MNLGWVVFVLVNGFIHTLGTIVDDVELGRIITNVAFAMNGMILCFMLGGIIQ